MKYTLKKKFRFESAHRLAKGYEGKCANIHGHSWNGEVAVECDDLDEHDMGVDYATLGKLCKEMEDLLDHAIILHKDDKELIALCEKNKWKVFTMRDNPTSEALAHFIFDVLGEKIKEIPNASLRFVTIDETCTTSCCYGHN